jgi:hypothetical protein
MFRPTIAILLALTLTAGNATSQPLDIPLVIATKDDAPLHLDLADLDAMPQESFVTGTLWTEGETRFSGVPLAVLLDQAGIGDDATRIELVALNDYKVEIPLDEIEDTRPIVATRMDGKVMAVRDKGPYWLVYPYDEDIRYRTEAIYARSIWQLGQLRVSE